MKPEDWQKAKDVLFEALALPVEEREAFIRLKSSDPALAAEIIEMLKSYKSIPNLLDDGSLDAEDAGEEGDDVDEFADLPPGTPIQQFIVIDRLGGGGQGVVLLCHDRKLPRKVALKCLVSGGDKTVDRARVLQEAGMAAKIGQVPNIATIYDTIEHGERAFIVMEYVEGETLGARLKRTRLDMKDVVRIGRELAAALSAAHAHGIVHRDLKPANVQVTPSGTVKVLDFGVAQAVQIGSTASTGATTEGRARKPVRAGGGTIPYMSPEQLRAQAIDDRSDIYSLGLVLFEMATGRRPYKENGRAELTDAQARGPAPRADAMDRAVPRALATVIAKALEFDPADRYQSSVELNVALEGVERSLDRGGRRQLIRRWTARVAVGGLLVILSLSLIGFIVTVGFNVTFGRIGKFGEEPWPEYFRWGVLAVVPAVLIMTASAVVTLAARWALQVLALVGPIGRVLKRTSAAARAIALALDLDRPSTMAQALTAIAVVSLGMVCWIFADVIRAWMSFVDSAPIERLLPIGYTAAARQLVHLYLITLDVMIVAFGLGLLKVIALRAKENTGDGRAFVGMLGGVIAVMALMAVFPYRTLNFRDFELVTLDGAQCFLIVERGGEMLISCPGSIPPRNRTVKSGEQSPAKRLGRMENIFKEMSQSRTER